AIALVSIVVGLAFGVQCIRRVRATDASAVLRSSMRTTDASSARRGRRSLVAAQVALSVLLLVGAGLLLRSFSRLRDVRSGFIAGGAITGDMNIPIAGAFNPDRDGRSWSLAFGTVIAHIAQLPSVTAVGAASAIPLTGAAEGGTFRIVGRTEPREEDAPRSAYVVTEGDYFRAAGITVLRGRAFGRNDQRDAPAVAIISRSLAERYFGGEDPIGRDVRALFEFTPNARPRTIVGVVDDVKLYTLDGDVIPTMYVPEQQMTYPALSIVVRTHDQPNAIAATVRRELHMAHPTATLSNVRTLEDVLQQSLARQRFTLTLLTAFATTALLLAVLGLYAVIALSVQARRHELGVRLALGARPQSLVFLVLREGMRLAGVGVTLGIVAALALSGVLRALLYGVDARDALVFGSAALIVVAVAAVATWIPAREAARGSPSEALRGQ
ncbi:MAG: ABC transporter permease, partial [Gemmatimonadaceae bacterium]